MDTERNSHCRVFQDSPGILLKIPLLRGRKRLSSREVYVIPVNESVTQNGRGSDAREHGPAVESAQTLWVLLAYRTPSLIGDHQNDDNEYTHTFSFAGAVPFDPPITEMAFSFTAPSNLCVMAGYNP